MIRADTLVGKRKADDDAEAPAKKAKTDTANADPDALPPSCNVFVGGLSWNVDNDWLQSEFAECGELVSARVIWDHNNNRSKGFGYVEFADLEASAKAVAMDGKEIDGRSVRVNYATPRAEKPNTEKRQRAFGDQISEPAETLFVGNLAFSANEGESGLGSRIRISTRWKSC